MRKVWPCLAAVFIIMVVGCRSGNTKTAVETAVQKHLRGNPHLMLNSFKTQFEGIDVKDDTAQALVKYQSRDRPELAVEVRYFLKKIDGQWQVVSSSPAGGQMANPANPHGGAGAQEGTGAAPPQQGAPGPIASH